MKKCICLCLVLLTLFFSSCNRNAQNSDSEKEVIFYNYIHDQMEPQQYYGTNKFYSRAYGIDTTNEDALYAFLVTGYDVVGGIDDGPVEEDYVKSEENYRQEVSAYRYARGIYEAKRTVEILEKTGVTILPEYPLCYYSESGEARGKYCIGLCVVVGTYQELEELFHDTNPIDGVRWKLWPATRPDMLDILSDVGWIPTEENYSISSGFSRNRESIRSIIGEESKVTISIKLD